MDVHVHVCGDGGGGGVCAIANTSVVLESVKQAR